MRDSTPWLQVAGACWIGLGVLGLAWSLASLVLFPPGQPLFPDWAAVRALSLALYWRPWAEFVGAIAAPACLVVGWGLVRRTSWVQTLIIPAHLLLIVYAIVGWITFEVHNSSLPEQQYSLLFPVWIVVNAGMLFWVSNNRSTEVLSWLPLRTAAIVPTRCEFCGTPLDLETRLCPECKTMPDATSKPSAFAPPRARLVGLSDGVEFGVEPYKRTRIGRGLSGNDINLNNPTVSRSHAQIEYEQGHYVVTALQDLNGTFVNDKLVRQRKLENQDQVRFGRVGFLFQIVEHEKVEPK